MRLIGGNKNKAAAVFMDYVIILGLVSLILTAMNIYIKRGIQGKIWDMTRYFIGAPQVVEVNPSASTSSNSETIYDSNTTNEELLGGATRITMPLDTTKISTKSEIIDSDVYINGQPFIPAEGGGVTVPNAGTK